MQRAMEAEGCMERYWANIIFNASESESGIAGTIQSFWYWDNYSLLTNYELDSLRAAGVSVDGEGHLQRFRTTASDRYHANVIASSWVQKLPNHGDGSHARYTFRNVDVWDITSAEFESYDVVWIAASVGIDGKEKRSIVDHVKKGMRPEVEHEVLANMEVIRLDS
ncbi:hypothetical protein BU17DRAFT_72290 [Hysterangium stoloniferum]|nr:hypothetical protein BU17DRAFT_72290 [Hysterangium stoloniferum]